jgi:cytoskeletal protein RodZ
MAFGRNNASSELPESQIEYRDQNSGRRIVALIIYIILALAVAVLVVLAGRWIYHKVSNNSGPTPTAVTPQATNSGNKTSPSPATPATPPPSASSKTRNSNQNKSNNSTGSSSGSSSSGSSANGKSTTPSPTTQPSPQPTSLPNNGPGEVAALFIGTSVVAAGLHYAVATWPKRTQQN